MNQRRTRGGGGYRGALGGGGGAGANAGARGALLLAVAVILGIVLLQQVDNGPSAGTRVSTATSAPQETSTTRRNTLTTVPLVTTTTAKVRAKADVKVLVANGAGVKGLGAATTNALKNLGYATLTPTDATVNVDKTSVQFAEGYDAEAREVAQSLSLPPTVATKLASPPVAAADIGDAKVIVILGADSTTTTTSTTVRAATTTTR